MSRTTFNRLVLAGTLTAGIVLAVSGAAEGASVAGQFINDSRCDSLPDLLLPRELGDSNMFSISDSIVYHDHRYHLAVGVPDDGIANEWLVHITNVSGQAWQNLFFVADAGATIGNADGTVADTLGAPGQFTDAFRIDSLGVNRNLISESMSVDGIFQPGEEWEFAVTNFGTGLNAVPPILISPGIFAGSSPLGTDGGLTHGNASILAMPVPEPTTVGAIAFLAVSLLARRRPRRRLSRRS